MGFDAAEYGGVDSNGTGQQDRLARQIDERDPVSDPRGSATGSLDDPGQRKRSAFVTHANQLEHALGARRIEPDPSNIECFAV
jgi:hypothetical protein